MELADVNNQEDAKILFERYDIPYSVISRGVNNGMLRVKNARLIDAQRARTLREELTANMIVSGYAFTRLPDGYRVINLNRLESVALFSKNGDVIETSMCDIETTIALKYFEKNRKFIDD